MLLDKINLIGYEQKGKTMKKVVLLMFFILFFSKVSSAAGLIEGKGISLSQSYDFYSSYSWRGFLLDSDPVMQPRISASARNFTAAFWSSWDMSNTDQLQSDQKDLSLDYTYEFAYFSASLGNIYYNFPGRKASNSEYYFGLQFESLPFTPNLIYYADYTTGRGSYLSLDLVKTFPVDTKGLVQFSLGAHAGYNNQLLIRGRGEDVSIIGDLGLRLTERLGLSLVAGQTLPFDGLADSNDGNQKSQSFCGIRIGAEY